jgi:DNA/RNA endonuclease G (NUC1)
MKRFYLVLLSFIVLVVAAVGINFHTKAQTTEQEWTKQPYFVSQSIVISQFYGGGGQANAPYTNDFVELFNRGSAPVSLNGFSVQYAGATSSNWLVTPLSNITLQPGQYYLIQYASNGTVGSALPTPDLIAPQVTTTSGTFIPNLSSTSGKIALVNTTTPLPSTSNCPLGDASIIDFVGYGTSASCFENTKTPDLSVTTAGIRKGGGCVETDDNNADFSITLPAPRNTSSATNACLGGNPVISATASANPNTVVPGASTLLRVAVSPATTPPSTAITVVGNLTNIGGSATQTFYDDGTNGDATAGDNIFSFQYTIPTTLGGGTTTVSTTVQDAQGRTASPTISITISAAPTNDDPLILGNPSDATGDVANENNYLMVKPQYTLSYNRSKGEANWVGWRLDSTWITGAADRQDDFRPDPALPANWYRVTPEDYTGSGYDRGHMTPSGDRTRSVADNSATFLMTNILPQLPANNQGPWNDFENYLRTLANQGNELYIFSGGAGVAATIAGGKVVVPQVTWKVVVVLPNGSDDLSRITKATRTIAIIVPNQGAVDIRAPWRNFRVKIDEVENLTGYNFFSAVPINTQTQMERRKDTQ